MQVPIKSAKLARCFIYRNKLSGNRLYKKEKLCGTIAINTLFTRGEGSVATAYPLRAVWRVNPRRELKNVQFLVSVPKKRFKHAVDRVKLRRRIREAYRLNRQSLVASDEQAVDVAFIYLGDSMAKYADIEQSLIKILDKISKSLTPTELPENEEAD